MVLVIRDARERSEEGQEEGHQHHKQLETRALVEDRNTRYIQLSKGGEGTGVVYLGYTGGEDDGSSPFQLTARNMKAYPDIDECPDGHDNLMVS